MLEKQLIREKTPINATCQVFNFNYLPQILYFDATNVYRATESKHDEIT